MNQQKRRHLPFDYSYYQNTPELQKAFMDSFKEALKVRRMESNLTNLSKENVNINFLYLGFILSNIQLVELYLFSSFDNKFQHIMKMLSNEKLKLPKLKDKSIVYLYIYQSRRHI